MRLFLRIIVAVAMVPAWIGIHADPAAAQTFDDRWTVIPKAHAEPAPEVPGHSTEDLQTQPSNGSPQSQPLTAGEPTPGSEEFSGKASFYSYQTGKTADGSSFDRNLLTAAHRSLPFGTRVRVTDLATGKSVVVRITDRGPNDQDRILDLSLGAARSLGITDRGVIQIRAEVL